MVRPPVSCVFVHGWGMNHAVWQPVIERLPGWINPIAIDLPGHGLRTESSFASLQDLVDELSQVVSDSALWIGWSLGGLAVMQLALQQPEKVKAMMQVASSPCFVAKPGWACGMRAEIFDSFAAELEKDFAATIRRFLSLQVKGSEAGRQILKTLRKHIEQMPGANPQALNAGLKLLKQTDLRSDVRKMLQPTQWILGEQDGLVKARLAIELDDLMPAAQVALVSQAAHAPFLSHTEYFTEQLIMFAEKHV